MNDRIKLLVNNAQGLQEILDIHVTGFYSDPTAVVWDERKDGPLPLLAVQNLGGIVRSGNGPLSVDPVKLTAQQNALAAQAQADAKKVTDKGARKTTYGTLKKAKTVDDLIPIVQSLLDEFNLN